MDDTNTHDDEDIIAAILIDDEEDIVIDLSDNPGELANVVSLHASTRHPESLRHTESLRHPERSEGSLGETSDLVIEVNETSLGHSEERSNEESQESVVVDTFLEKRLETFKAQTRTRKQRVIIAIGAVAALITIVLLALESPIYNVDNINVVNTSATPLSDAESAQITEATSEVKGSPLYRVNTSSSTSDISEMESISDVSVSKQWPGTLVYTINRRTPAAYIATDKGYVLVDTTGYVFGKMEAAPAGVPVFEGISEITLHKEVPNKNFLAVLSDAPEEIKGQIVRVTLSDDGTYDATLSDGITVKLGQPTELDKKLAIAWSIINAKKRSEIGYIDVSVPSLPVSGSPQLQL